MVKHLNLLPIGVKVNLGILNAFAAYPLLTVYIFAEGRKNSPLKLKIIRSKHNGSYTTGSSPKQLVFKEYIHDKGK